MKQFLADKCNTVPEHLPYLPDLTLCNFKLFPKIKSALNGIHSQCKRGESLIKEDDRQRRPAALLPIVVNSHTATYRWKIAVRRKEFKAIDKNLSLIICDKFLLKFIFDTSPAI